MKKLLFVFVLGAFAACGNGSSDSTTDTTTMGSGSEMSTDTSSMMGADTGTMSTPH